VASNYPVALDNFGHAHAASEVIASGDINDLADAIDKIEVELGIDPSGTFDTVGHRFDGIITQLGLIPTISLNTASRVAAGWSLADFSKCFDSTSTNARSVTIPQITTLDAPEGSFFYVRRGLTGTVTVQGEIAGMILNPETGTLVDSISLPTRGSRVLLVKQRATLDIWDVSGKFT
jgi:hypothetical protein